VNRCVAFPVAVASDGSSIHEIRRDANGRPWPAGPAAEPPSTGATTVASIPRVDGLRGGSVDPNGRVYPIDGAGQESRGGGLYALTGPTGMLRPSERRHTSPVVWSAPTRTSTISCPDAILTRDRPRYAGQIQEPFLAKVFPIDYRAFRLWFYDPFGSRFCKSSCWHCRDALCLRGSISV
jgi:hypothetical protein